MFKAYKFRAYPTEEQKTWFEKHFEVNRYLYNTLLKRSDEEYKQQADRIFREYIQPINFYSEEILSWSDDKWKIFLKEAKKGAKGYSKNELSKMITKIISDERIPWVNKEYDGRAMREVAGQIDRSYTIFFEGGRFPRYKKKGAVRSVKFPIATVGEWKSIYFINEHILTLPKKIKLEVIKHREVIGEIKSATVTKSASGKWYVSLLAELPTSNIYKKTGRTIAIDQGTRHFITGYTSQDEFIVIDAPPIDEVLENKINNCRKKLTRKRVKANSEKRSLHESKNYQKNRIKLAKLLEKQRLRKEYFLHDLSNKLIKEYDVIYLESWSVRRIINTNIKQKGQNTTQYRKRKVKNIMHLSFDQFRSQLKEKAEMYNKQVISMPTDFSPNRYCSSCGVMFSESISHNTQEIKCPECNSILMRNENSAKNIFNYGRKLQIELENQ